MFVVVRVRVMVRIFDVRMRMAVFYGIFVRVMILRMFVVRMFVRMQTVMFVGMIVRMLIVRMRVRRFLPTAFCRLPLFKLPPQLVCVRFAVQRDFDLQRVNAVFQNRLRLDLPAFDV